MKLEFIPYMDIILRKDYIHLVSINREDSSITVFYEGGKEINLQFKPDKFDELVEVFVSKLNN